MKKIALTIGYYIACIFIAVVGEWTPSLTTLCVVMALDYATACILAVVWKKSPKTNTGGLSSSVAIKGVFKKVGYFIVIIIAHRLDLLFNTDVTKSSVICFLISGECLSVIENLGTMGVPIPKFLKDCVEVLKNKGDKNE